MTDIPPLGDLLARWRAGDTDALAAIFDAAAPGLFRTALHLAPDAAAAEDALQETFLAFLEAARGGAPIREVGPWLAGTLRNKVLRGRRTERRAPDAFRLEPRGAESDPATSAVRAEEAERVHRALDELPETFREVAILRWRYGMEPAAIADARGVAPGTVRSILSRAAERLRTTLGALGAMCFPGRPPRGLDAVRREILRASRIPAPVAVSTAAGVLGGLVMMKKVAAAVVLVLLLVGGWMAVARLGPAAAPSADPAGADDASRAASTIPPARSRVHAAAAPADPPASAVPSPTVRRAFPRPEPAGSLVVRAKWEDDATPAAGIWVRVYSWDGPDPFLHLFRERTGADGTVAFPAVFSGRAGVTVESGGGAMSVVDAGGRREIDVRVPKALCVEGAVVDRDGKPVPDAVIADRGREIARAGPDGAFRLRAVRNHAGLGASAPGYAPSARYDVRGAPGTTVHLRMLLPGAGGAVTGRVLDPDGCPLAGARVQVRPEDYTRQIVLEDGTATQPQEAIEVRTDDAGRFRFDGVEPGKNVVRARAHGFALGQSRVEVVAGKSIEFDVVLAAGAAVAGTVKDSGDGVIADATVLVGRYGDFDSSQVHTGRDGTYRLTGLTPGEMTIEVDADKKGETSTSLSVGAGETARWDPVLSSGLAATGRVVDGAGRPRARFLVWMACMQRQYTWQGSAVTDAEGRFSIGNCSRDWLRIEVSAAATGGNWPMYPSVVRTNVAAGGPDIDITVEDRDLPSAFVHGSVRGPDGKPAEGASIQVRHPAVPRTPFQFTDPGTGTFRIGPLPPADYDVTVRAKGHPDVRLGTRTLVPGDEVDLGTIQLTTGGHLELSARRDGGGAVVRCWGEVFAADGTSAGHLTADKGVARCGPLAPGSYRVRIEETVSATEQWVAMIPVEIRGGAKASADVVLRAAGSRTFRADPATGEAEVRVVVRDATGGVLRDHTLPLPVTLALPPGSYTIAASTAAGLRADAHFEVAAAGAAEEPVVLALR